MKRKLFTIVGVMATSLWSIANATTVTYNFSGTQQNSGGTGVAQNGGGGMYFSTSSQTFGSGTTIAVYGEKTSQAGDGGPGSFTGTTGLFEVTNGSGGNSATGIGPYDNLGGSSPNLNFTGQAGIASSTAVDPLGAPTDQVLLLNLSNFAAGSTVSFTMATGVNAVANTGIDVWTGAPTGTPLGIGTGWGGQTASNSLTTESISEGSVNGAGGGAGTHTFNLFTNNMPGGEWIAIQADCHYLLLQSITITSPSGVPEPSFYGFFAVAMVGLAFGARKLRARATAEQA